MSNEAEIINNPDSTPGAVSTGYQLQNTNLIAQRAGIDLSNVTGGVGNATLEISGPIDVNGVMYDIKSAVIFTPPAIGRYYITLNGAGPTNLTPTLGTSAGTFDALKNARYDASNYRVLNWVIYFDGTNCFANRLMTPENERTQIEDLDEPEETWITTNTSWIAKRSKYYNIWVTGSGGDGASTTVAGNKIGGGGGAGATVQKRIFIESGTEWNSVFPAVEGGFATFSDGVTTISAENGDDGNSGPLNCNGGAGGSNGTSYDNIITGGSGYGGIISTAGTSVGISGGGGCSFYGGGARSETATAFTNGSTGKAFGSGGSGAISISGSSNTGGAGKVGVIRIIG